MKRILNSSLLAIIAIGGVLFAPSATFAIEGDDCALPANERMNPARQTAVDNVRAANDGVSVDTFSCQNISSAPAEAVSTRCVTGLCAGSADIRCCVAGTAVVRPGTATGDTAETPAPSRAPTGIVLPACVSDGNCQLDDIIQTGVNFANFLFGISGAVFLAIFVYAGVLYITAGGSTDRVSKAKKMLTQATIGMILVVGAGVLVTFVHDAFRGGSGDRCESTHEGFTCTTLPEANLSEEIRNRGCVTGLCPGGTNNVCCPTGAPTPDAESETGTCVCRRTSGESSVNTFCGVIGGSYDIASETCTAEGVTREDCSGASSGGITCTLR